MTALSLKGKRIFLREVSETDAHEEYCNWLNDPEVNRYLETRFSTQTTETIKRYIREKTNSPDEYFFAICLLDNGRHIGNIKLGPINWIHRRGDISLFIGAKDLWNRGYATEAIALITEYAFKALHLNKLKAGAYANNIGSINAFESTGFQKEGLLKNDVICDGKPMDIVLLGLSADDYRKEGEQP